MTLIYSTVITSAAFALFALLHSVLANQHIKQMVFKKWPGFESYYRLTYTVISIVTLAAWYFFAPFPEGVLYNIPQPWSSLFHLLQGVGLAGFFFSLRPIDVREFLGIKQFQTSPANRLDDQMVTRGLYRWVRHPLYSSSMIILLFNPYMSYKWGLVTLLFGLYFWIGSIYEERNLVEKYGEEYRRYKQQVPRFIPKFPLF